MGVILLFIAILPTFGNDASVLEELKQDSFLHLEYPRHLGLFTAQKANLSALLPSSSQKWLCDHVLQ